METVSHYRLSGRLGESGTGVISQAIDAHLDPAFAHRSFEPSAFRSGRKQFEESAPAPGTGTGLLSNVCLSELSHVEPHEL